MILVYADDIDMVGSSTVKTVKRRVILFVSWRTVRKGRGGGEGKKKGKGKGMGQGNGEGERHYKSCSI